MMVVTRISVRKAVAMAAATLLTTGHRQCLERLDGEFCK